MKFASLRHIGPQRGFFINPYIKLSVLYFPRRRKRVLRCCPKIILASQDYAPVWRGNESRQEKERVRGQCILATNEAASRSSDQRRVRCVR